MDDQKKQDERKDRLQRLAALDQLGIHPYPARLEYSRKPIHSVLTNFETLSNKRQKVSCSGRVVSKRMHGKLIFLDLQDASGKIQLYCKSDEISEKNFSLISSIIDLGDFLLAHGVPTLTKRGERSILVSQIQFLAKSLRPLPEKWHGLTNIETRFRKRELDLLANPDVVSIFTKRAICVATIRSFLSKQNYLEVETPILQPIPGGATAKPFVTHHESLNQDMYLRIAPELYLKRLIVGGFERVFEIARCFRNEGIDTSHNPEFTQVELYAAYEDYRSLMKLTEKLISEIVKRSTGSLTIPHDQTTISFKPPYPRKRFMDLITEKTHGVISLASSITDLVAYAKTHNVEVRPEWGKGKILDEYFKTLVRPSCVSPLFVTHHPIELSPLAKKTSPFDGTVERFQLLAGGMEVVNAFSELNDPLDQQKRFLEQDALRKKGDDEAQYTDPMFVESLEYGLPPTAGLGLGIDRMVQLLTNQHNIKEVILFPTLRKK